MPIVRESPRAQVSPAKNNAQWPPRSPLQALLSSPSGRKRWQDYKTQRESERSPSPSPRRNNVRSSQMLQDLAGGASGDEDGDDGEDEETLQLQLAEIQAKLRLKKLQNAKKKGDDSRRSQERQTSVPSARTSPRKLYESALPRAAVQVPLSPATDRQARTEQVSPARARLGLTTNPRASDVSLKRARDGNPIKRTSSQQSLRAPVADLPRPKSFSARLAESKQRDDDRQAKHVRLQKVRSSGFGHTRTESNVSSASSVRRSRVTNDEGPSSAGRASESRTEARDQPISRSTSARFSREREQQGPLVNGVSRSEPQSGTGHDAGDSDESLDIQHTDPDSGYDPFSKTHLKRREIPHSVVAREMEGKEVYTLPRLLKEVKSPDYEPPDCECDYVVFAVLASKSNPLDHAATHRTSEQHGDDKLEAPKNKFMVLHLTDLKWEIDCFLFGTAFNQFWKLTPGTLLAIMNPAVLPPKGSQHNGKFSLKLGSSEDAVMEIGIARDLGYCSAVKKDGQQCGDWVDKRKTEACEFHINLQIEKARKGRMEVNTMFNDGTKEDRTKSRAARGGERSKKHGPKVHREYGQLYNVNTGMGKSAASLLDDDDKRIYDDMTEEDASRKRLAAAQKERDLARQLKDLGSGSGPGADMIRARHTKTSSSTTLTSTTSTAATGATAAEEARNALFAKKSASELGLLGKKASDTTLEPAKDRRKHFGLGVIGMSSSKRSDAPMGWGGARKAGLLQTKESSRLASPEKGQTRLEVENKRPNLVRSRSQESSIRSTGSQSPTKKKARFALEKGIREPGRESLPGQGEKLGTVDSDDDDLDIV